MAIDIPRHLRNASASRCISMGVQPGYYDCPVCEICPECGRKGEMDRGDTCPTCGYVAGQGSANTEDCDDE